MVKIKINLEIGLNSIKDFQDNKSQNDNDIGRKS